ncbi:MAG: hypothetical protein ABWZ40_06045 [Caulobacterales bacterium]
MSPRSVDGLAQVSAAALAVTILAFAPDVAGAQDFSSSVRYVDAPSAVPIDDNFKAGPDDAKALSLGDVNPGTGTLKLSVAPNASIAPFRGGEQQSGGLEVRLGSDSDSQSPKDGDWFVFAGAQRKALDWDGSASPFDVEMVELNKSATVGDLKAGVAYQMGPAQMSLGYMKRTYKSGDLSDKRSYAALSVSFRR